MRFIRDIPEAERTEWDRRFLECTGKGDVPECSFSSEFIETYSARREALFRAEMPWRCMKQKKKKQECSDPDYPDFCRDLGLRVVELPAGVISEWQREAILRGALTCGFEEECEAGNCDPIVFFNERAEPDEQIADRLLEQWDSLRQLPVPHRIRAIHLITEHAGKTRAEAVAETLLSKWDPVKDTDPLLNRHFLLALGRLNAEKPQWEIVSFLLQKADAGQEPDPLVRGAAVAALSFGQTRESSSIQFGIISGLAELLDPRREPNSFVRREIVNSLVRLSQQGYSEAIKAFLQRSLNPAWETDENVREGARLALLQLEEGFNTDVTWIEHIQNFSPARELNPKKRREMAVDMTDLFSKTVLRHRELQKRDEKSKSALRFLDIQKNALLAAFIREMDPKWEPDAAVTEVMLTSLKQLGTEAREVSIVRRLLEMVGEGNGNVPTVLYSISGASGGEDVETLEENDRQMILLASAIASLRSVEELKELPLRETLIGFAKGSMGLNERARIAFLETLLAFEERDKTLLSVLFRSMDVGKEPSELLREQAVRALTGYVGTTGAGRIPARLLPLLDSSREKSEAVAEAAFDSYLAFHRPDAVLLLKLASDRKNVFPVIRTRVFEQIAKRIGEFPLDRLLPVLVGNLEEFNEDLGIVTLKILDRLEGHANTEKVVAVLENIVESESPLASDADLLLEKLWYNAHPDVLHFSEKIIRSDAFAELEKGLALLKAYRGAGVAAPQELLSRLLEMSPLVLNKFDHEVLAKARLDYQVLVMGVPEREDSEEKSRKRGPPGSFESQPLGSPGWWAKIFDKESEKYAGPPPSSNPGIKKSPYGNKILKSLSISFLREIPFDDRVLLDQAILDAAATDDDPAILGPDELRQFKSQKEIVSYLYRRELTLSLGDKNFADKTTDSDFMDYLYRLPDDAVTLGRAPLFAKAAATVPNESPSCERSLCLPNFFRVLDDKIRIEMINRWFLMIEKYNAHGMGIRKNSLTWLSAAANNDYFTDKILDGLANLLAPENPVRMESAGMRRNIAITLRGIRGIKGRPDIIQNLLPALSPEKEPDGGVRRELIELMGFLAREMAVDRLAPTWANWGKMGEPELITLINESTRREKEPDSDVRATALRVLLGLRREGLG